MKRLLIITLFILSLVTPVHADFMSDLIVTGTSGIWTDSRAYSTLADCITDVGASEVDIYIAKQEAVTVLTIPATVRLHFLKSGSIAPTGQLTLNTKQIFAGDQQIFFGTGDIDFSNGSVVRSSWFSDIVEAFNVTNDDNVTLIISKPAFITASCAVGDNVNLKWESPRTQLTANAGFTLSNIKNIEAGNFQLFAGAGTFTFQDNSVLKLSWFARLRSALTWISTNNVTLIVTGTNSVDYSDNVPGNISLNMESENGSFIISPGNTLTFSKGVVDKINVKWFGATGDGVTEDTSAIQTAFNIGYYAKTPIYFPPGDYLTDTITYYNQSFYGPPQNVWYPSALSAAVIHGVDSKDIFQYPDPGGDATTRIQGSVVKDITLIVNDDTDASGSFSRGGVGNAAMAWPVADGADYGSSSYPLNARFQNVHITSKSLTPQNASCGFYFQNPPYDTVFDNVEIARMVYGYWEDYPNTNETSMEYASDANTYSKMVLNGNTNPFRSYNAAFSTILGMQIYATTANQRSLSLLSFTSSVRTSTYNWSINNLYVEGNDASTGELSVIQGRGHIINGGGPKTHYGADYITWEADECHVINSQILGSTADASAVLKVSGNRNRFEVHTKNPTSTFFEDTGTANNLVTTGYDSATEYTSKLVSQGHGRFLPALRKGADFIRSTIKYPYNNNEDLLIYPSDIQWESPVTQPTITKDSSLQSGEYVALPSPGSGYFSIVANQTFKAGEGYPVPAGRVKIFVKVKAASSATTSTWLFNVNSVTKGYKTLSYTTSWSVVSFYADCAGITAGHTVQIQVGEPAAGQIVHIAWIAIVPLNEESLGANIGVASGLYDFAVDTGAIGDYVLGVLPDNAVITRAWYETITDPTSGGAATIAIGVAANDANGIVTATAYDNAIWNPGWHDGTPDGAAANFTTQTTDQRNIILSIAGATLTAGKIRVFWEYSWGE